MADEPRSLRLISRGVAGDDSRPVFSSSMVLSPLNLREHQPRQMDGFLDGCCQLWTGFDVLATKSYGGHNPSGNEHSAVFPLLVHPKSLDEEIAKVKKRYRRHCAEIGEQCFRRVVTLHDFPDRLSIFFLARSTSAGPNWLSFLAARSLRAGDES